MSSAIAPTREVRNISVAVAFDDMTDPLLNAAVALCRRTGASLRLVHVCDPWTKSFLAAAVEASPPALAAVLQRESARTAKRRLAFAAATIEKGIEVKTGVLKGEIAGTLATDADHHETDLLVVGAHGERSPTSLSISTAISIILESKTPVLVINETCRFNGQADPLRMVIADDLSEDSDRALSVALNLAAQIKNVQLLHIHVDSQTDSRSRRRSASKNSEDPVLTPEYFDNLRNEVGDRMSSRAGNHPGRIIASGGSYSQEVVAGNVATEIDRSAYSVRADLMVFGQHKVFHGRPLQVGQMPFKTMLSFKRPVIVVPDHRQDR